jgi:hypothetical protein
MSAPPELSQQETISMPVPLLLPQQERITQVEKTMPMPVPLLLPHQERTMQVEKTISMPVPLLLPQQERIMQVEKTISMPVPLLLPQQERIMQVEKTTSIPVPLLLPQQERTMQVEKTISMPVPLLLPLPQAAMIAVKELTYELTFGESYARTLPTEPNLETILPELRTMLAKSDTLLDYLQKTNNKTLFTALQVIAYKRVNDTDSLNHQSAGEITRVKKEDVRCLFNDYLGGGIPPLLFKFCWKLLDTRKFLEGSELYESTTARNQSDGHLDYKECEENFEKLVTLLLCFACGLYECLQRYHALSKIHDVPTMHFKLFGPVCKNCTRSSADIAHKKAFGEKSRQLYSYLSRRSRAIELFDDHPNKASRDQFGIQLRAGEKRMLQQTKAYVSKNALQEQVKELEKEAIRRYKEKGGLWKTDDEQSTLRAAMRVAKAAITRDYKLCKEAIVKMGELEPESKQKSKSKKNKIQKTKREE